MGHSLGGYFTLFALSCEWPAQPFFSRFVAASPSLEYAEGYLPVRFRLLSRQPAVSRSLLITAGEEEHLKELPDLLEYLKKSPLNIQSEVFPKMNHMETAVITFRKALQLK